MGNLDGMGKIGRGKIGRKFGRSVKSSACSARDNNPKGFIMTDQNDIPTVTMTNTKKDMIEAYEAMKQKLHAQEKELLNAEKTRKQMEKKLAEATADAQASQDPLQRFSNLRSDISKELTGLAERFEQEIDAYSKIKAAAKAKQEELDTIYGVESAASDLAALIEAQQAKKKDFETDMATRRAAFESEIKGARAEWEKEKAAHEQEAKELAGSIKKQRQREKEEFEYAFAREKEQRENALEDDLQTITKDISKKREDFEQEYNHRKNELDIREEDIAKREKEIAVLQKEVDTFPKRLETAVEKAVEDTTARLTHDFEKDKALMESRFEGEKNVFSSKIESLEKLVEGQAAQIADLAKRHEHAYEKVQDIANRAVAAAKREFISIPVTTQSSSASDADRKS